MKALLRASLLALAFGAIPSLAHAWGIHAGCVDAGAKVWFNWNQGPYGVAPQACPWFTYYPYLAEFQTPAPVCGWPYWPTPAAVPPAGATAASLTGPGPQPAYGTSQGMQR